MDTLKTHVKVQYIIERHLLERVIIGKFNSKSAVKVLFFCRHRQVFRQENANFLHFCRYMQVSCLNCRLLRFWRTWQAYLLRTTHIRDTYGTIDHPKIAFFVPQKFKISLLSLFKFNLQFNIAPLYIVTKEAKSITSSATFLFFCILWSKDRF